MRILRKWKEQVDSGKFPRWEACKIISENTFSRFKEERILGTILHDSDIKAIMLEEARRINCTSFHVIYNI